MDLIDEQIKLSHLLFSERKCRICGEVKDLVSDFYLTRKERGTLPSAYSYECKICDADVKQHIANMMTVITTSTFALYAAEK